MKNILDFYKAKEADKKISMVTCYDYWSAKIIESSQVDCILVGDSVAMTMHGHRDTLRATPELMALHVSAVREGAKEKLIVGDMPFLAHRGSIDETLKAVSQIMRAGAQAVKIEGVDGSEDRFSYLVDSGVPVMGHLGLTPQSYHKFGGFKVQATDNQAKDGLLKQALKLQSAGCFAVVLECIPMLVAEHVTANLKIPTIGIGAGHGCDGQVLVFQDMMGLNPAFKPKFARRYLQGFELLQSAFNEFDRDVKSLSFPDKNESYE